jgi:hypothetical protein
LVAADDEETGERDGGEGGDFHNGVMVGVGMMPSLLLANMMTGDSACYGALPHLCSRPISD